MFGMLLDHAVDEYEERIRVEARLARDVRPGDAEAFLKILFISDQRIKMAGDPLDHLLAVRRAADGRPEFRAIVEVERGDGAGGLGGLHSLDDQRSGGLGERREDAAGMKPAHAAVENPRPVEVAGLEQGTGFIRAVVEDDRRPHSVAAIAVDGGDIGPAHAVVLEPFVERSHAGFAHAGLHELSDGIVDHSRRDARLHSEAVREVGGHVVFAAGDVNVDRSCLAERNHARVEPMHERAQREEVELTGIFAYRKSAHRVLPHSATLT